MWLTPFGLDVRYERPPVATVGLIVVMAGMYLYLSVQDPEVVLGLAFHPDAVRPWQSVTSLFVHGSWRHLVWNAVYLWVFARFVEERLGPWRFLLLFLAFGLAGDLTSAAKGVTTPSIGASGAIAGCMGLVLFTVPNAGIRLFLHAPVGRQRRWFLPAWLFLGLWIAGQFFGAYASMKSGVEVGIDWFAHAGGFLAGLVASWVLRAPRLEGTGWHLPRERRGGEKVSEAYAEFLAGEAVWRTIEEHMRERERPGAAPCPSRTTSAAEDDPPEVYDITPPGWTPPPRRR